jgi:hypothetical protein
VESAATAPTYMPAATTITAPTMRTTATTAATMLCHQQTGNAKQHQQGTVHKHAHTRHLTLI